MIATPRPTGFVLRGWHVLVGFVVFFGVDVAVNSYFISSAYKTFPGETDLAPYEDGVAYNATLRERRVQALLGWRLAAGPDGPGRLRVEVRDRRGAPLSGLRVTAHIERPATEAGERDVPLPAVGDGTYAGPTGVSGGFWDVEVTARDSRGAVARADRRLALP